MESAGSIQAAGLHSKPLLLSQRTTTPQLHEALRKGDVDLILTTEQRCGDNGEVLLEKGTHTGTFPGRVITNARHQAHR